MIFADRLRELRKSKGLSQSELAKRLFKSPTQASRDIANTINTLELGGTSVAHEEIKKP